MNVSLMSFSKKKNSTATPSSGGSALSGTLREGCSVIRPVIGFDLGRITYSNYNYAYISDFGRYYYIQDWAWEGGLWWAYMETDPMASFKDGIGTSSCYVLRAASEYDNSIIDNMYPTEAYSYGTSPAEYVDYLGIENLSDSMYIVGIIGQGDGGSGGAVTYYAFTEGQLSVFKSQLLTNTDFVGITEITTELLKSLLNPFQYVVSCMWFPISYSNVSGSTVSSIKLGWWTINATAKKISATTYSLSEFSINVEAVPKAVTDGGGFRFSSPFSTYTLIIPPIGEINLDSQIIAEGVHYSGQQHTTQVSCKIRIDLMTGNGYMELFCREYTLGFYEGKFGVACQLGQVTQNVAGSISSASGALASMAAGNAIVGGLSAIASVISGIQYAMPRVETRGLNAGRALYSYGAYVTSKYNPPVVGDPNENGRPLFRTKTISSLSGYIKTMNADVVLAGATDAEQEQVRAFMNGGFFYE